jgi:hypothetical protein
MLGLASAATSAGLAMACPFGSSAEFEAAMIVRRRKAAARLRNAGRATSWPPPPLSSWFLFYVGEADRRFRAAPQSYSGVLALVGAGLKPALQASDQNLCRGDALRRAHPHRIACGERGEAMPRPYEEREAGLKPAPTGQRAWARYAL